MTFTAQQHVALRRIVGVAASPCGTWLAVTVQRLDRDGAQYLCDLWRVPTDGGAAVQLTRGDSKDHAPCFRHDGSLAFLSNRTPNELPPDPEAADRMQVWVLPKEGGEPRQLTDLPLGVTAFRCARDASRLALLAPVLSGVEPGAQRETLAKRRKGGPSARRFVSQPVRHWDSWLHQNADLPCLHLLASNADGGETVDLTPDARGDFAIDPTFDVSADGLRVVATRLRVGKDRELDSSLLLIDAASGEQRDLGVADSVTFEAPAFSPDGTRIAVVRAHRGAAKPPHPRVTVFDVASGAMQESGLGWDHWPGVPRWSTSGEFIYFSADEGGHTPVFALRVQEGTVERLSGPGSDGFYEHLAVLPDGRIGGIRSTTLMPPECFVMAPRRGADAVMLDRLSGFGAADAWAQVESFTVPSTDGTPIQTFLVKPRDTATGVAKRLPLALLIHGGPIGANRDGWHWRWNPLLLVAQGYAVALPNPRGSTGFGQAFIEGIWGNVWGEQCYQDLMRVTDALCTRPDIDPERMVAMGGSFGGYMTNWIGTQTARFKCLVTHASIATMAQFTGTTDHPGWWYLEMGGENPYADFERFDRYAPIRQVRNWKSPVLIIHGERDYRCPINEGLNLFEALQYHGVPSELLIFPDEGHWIAKPRNTVAWNEAVGEFLGRYLGG